MCALDWTIERRFDHPRASRPIRLGDSRQISTPATPTGSQPAKPRTRSSAHRVESATNRPRFSIPCRLPKHLWVSIMRAEGPWLGRKLTSASETERAKTTNIVDDGGGMRRRHGPRATGGSGAGLTDCAGSQDGRVLGPNTAGSGTSLAWWPPGFLKMGSKMCACGLGKGRVGCGWGKRVFRFGHTREGTVRRANSRDKTKPGSAHRIMRVALQLGLPTAPRVPSDRPAPSPCLPAPPRLAIPTRTAQGRRPVGLDQNSIALNSTSDENESIPIQIRASQQSARSGWVGRGGRGAWPRGASPASFLPPPHFIKTKMVVFYQSPPRGIARLFFRFTGWMWRPLRACMCPACHQRARRQSSCALGPAFLEQSAGSNGQTELGPCSLHLRARLAFP